MMKKLKALLLLFIALNAVGHCFGQQRHVVSAGGGYGTSANYSMSYTIGEPYIVTATSANNHVTQGFQQPKIAVLSVEEVQAIQVSVYPNPASDYLNISTSENTKMYVYDIQGNLVSTFDILSSQMQIDVSDMSRGTYMLVFEANGTLANKMKIIIM